MRWLALAWLALLAVPVATAHGALEINEFDTYAISDFEGQEDSFPWEGFEIWDVYAGDGHLAQNGSHGVYFKANFAGDGTVRPSGSDTWEITFTFTVGNASYERVIIHDGSDVTSDFERLDWQIADGNVLQVHAWVPVAGWEGHQVTDLVVVSSVDGDPRDIAPGGIYDPATGEEVPVEAPPSPAFPAMGEGRIVDAVPLTGAAKFLNVSLTAAGDAYTFDVSNPLVQQGQHLVVAADSAWTISGIPEAQSLDGGASTTFTLSFEAPNGTIEPARIDLRTDIGGLQTYYVYFDDGVQITQDPDEAVATTVEPPAEDAPGWSIIAALGAVAVAMLRRRG